MTTDLGIGILSATNKQRQKGRRRRGFTLIQCFDRPA
jgi:hypothetical protein